MGAARGRFASSPAERGSGGAGMRWARTKPGEDDLASAQQILIALQSGCIDVFVSCRLQRPVVYLHEYLGALLKAVMQSMQSMLRPRMDHN